MTTDPELNRLKSRALNMLTSLSYTPENQIEGLFEFENGLNKPNNQPPTTVYLHYNGTRYRRNKYGKKWEQY